MNPKYLLTCLAAVLLSASAACASTLADWTFETSQPAGTPGAGVSFPGITPEVGAGTATGKHAGNAVYSTPAGNASAHSFSSTLWAVGDYYQFQVSTIGATHVIVTFDAISSGTGPRDFNLQYSTDGIAFTTFGSYTNGNTPSWGATGTPNATYSHSYDLSAVTAVNNAPTVYFRLVVADTTSSAGGTTAVGGTSRVDNFMVTAATGNPPVISNVTPSSLATNAGNNVSFTVALSQGDSPLFYYWYKGSIATPNLIASATTATLTLPSVVAADAANYFVVVSNAVNIATSSAIPLTVADPAINYSPSTPQTLLSNSTALLTVGVGGTPTMTYQWFTGTPGSGTQIINSSHYAGATSASLAISNLTSADASVTYYVTAHNGVGPDVTSPAITLNVASTTGPLAFWDFNNPYFSTNGPASDWGAGTASISNAVPFVLSSAFSDGNDSIGDYGGVNLSWGTDLYPAISVSNKTGGVQFNVSTVGARNIKVSYDLRETTTSSKYQRLQYTTDGTTFTDYPASSIYPGIVASVWQPKSFDLTGFPGVANNANFGIRLVTEFESTATYGVSNTPSYIGFSAGYGTAGTVSYDLVTISGDALTGAYNPPSISAIPDQTVHDLTPLSFNVSVSGGVGPLTVTAISLDHNILPDPGVSGTTVTLNPLGAGVDGVAPVVVTVTGANGDSAVASFNANVVPDNLPPVVTGLISTNTLVNTPITINFTVSDDNTPGSVTYSYSSSNTTIVPNTSLSLGGSGGSRSLTITPALNQLGVVPITLIANDNDPNTPKSTTIKFSLMVRPNLNVVLNDYFNYDNAPGSIVTNSGGFWQNHSGTNGQMQVGAGFVTVDGVDNTEDVNAQLIGQPYPTNNGAVLFSSCMVNYQTLPTNGGAYFGHFKDNTTSGFLGRIWASTNNAASGFYRLGIGNSSAASAASPQFPMDLALNQNYLVVTMLQCSNGFSTIWINPRSQSDTHVTDTTTVSNLVKIYQYALRESTADEGKVNVSNLRVGLDFGSVVDVLNIQQSGNNAVVTWENPVFTLQGSTVVSGPYTNIVGAVSGYTTPLPASGNMFYRLVH